MMLEDKIAFGLHACLFGTPIFLFIDQFIFNDWSFAISLFILVILDTATGGIASVLNYQFSGQKFWMKLAKKLFALVVVLVCIGVLKKTQIAGSITYLANIVDAAAYSIMIAFEGASVLKNTYRIYPWEPIKIILEKLEYYYNEKKNNKIDENEQKSD